MRYYCRSSLLLFCVVGLIPIGALAIGIASTTNEVGQSFETKDGTRLLEKVDLIVRNYQLGSIDPEPVTIYQHEVNAYIRLQLREQLPDGINDPLVSLDTNGEISVQATIDLSAVTRNRQPNQTDLFGRLNGQLLVAASGRLYTENRTGRVEIRSVTVGGIGVPLGILAEIVRYYSRSVEKPDGIDLFAPFELPYGITEVNVTAERVVVIQ